MSQLAPKQVSGRVSPSSFSSDRSSFDNNHGRVSASLAAEQYALQLLAKSANASQTPTDDYRIGERVWVGGTKPGIIVYIGEVHFGAGEWAGIVLDSPTGKNNGTVNGKQYFQCEPKRGVFSRLNKLTRTALPVDSTVNNQADENRSPKSAGTATAASAAAKTAVVDYKNSPADTSGSPRSSNSSTPRHASADGQSAVFPTDVNSISDGSTSPAFSLGDRVTVGGYKNGTLRYLGTTDFAAGIWAGVELDEPIGKNDGCVAGTRYFNCNPMFGLFTPVHKLSPPLDSNSTPPTNADSRHKDLKRFPASNRSGNDLAYRKETSSPVPAPPLLKTKNGSSSAVPSITIDNSCDESLNREGVEQQAAGFRRTESSNSVTDNDEIARRLKQFIEKLENDKIELYHQLQEEKRKVEDLQFTLEEAAIEKSDIEAHMEKKADQLKELEERLRKETELTERLSRELAASKFKTNISDSPADIGDQVEDYLDQIEELAHKLSIAESKLQVSQSAVGSEMASSSAAQVQAELEKEKSERHRLIGKLNSMKEDVKKLSHDKEMVENQRLEAVNQREKLAAEKSKLIAERDKAVTDRDKLLAERDKLAAEKERAAKDAVVAQKKLKDTDVKIKEMRDNLEKMEKTHLLQLTENRKQMETMQAEMNSLIATHKQLLPYKQQAEQLLVKVEKLSNERGTLKEQVSAMQAALQSHQQLEREHATCKANMRDLQNRFSEVIKEFEVEKNKLVNIVENTKKSVLQKDKEMEELLSELSALKAGVPVNEQQRVQQLRNSQINANANADTNESVSSSLQSENQSLKTEVEFLKSVIVEIQRKNVELESWKKQQQLMTAANGHGSSLAHSSQLFCDICGVSGQHDTEDCPQQET